MNLIHAQRKLYWGFIVIVSLLTLILAVYGAFTLMPRPGKDLDTFKILEHSVWVLALVVVATHLVLAVFARRQKVWFDKVGEDHKESLLPPSPILYPFFCGKFFMMIRLFAAYSSGDLGTSIDYFVKQEMILIFLHIIISAVLLSRRKGDPHSANDMNFLVLGVTGMDILKTVLMYVFWAYYQKGVIYDIFERLPNKTTRVAVALVVHAILDVMQTVATVFTMWVADAVTTFSNTIQEKDYIEGNEKDTNNSENKFWLLTRSLLHIDDEWCLTRFLLHIDDEWCRLLFGKARRRKLRQSY